MSGVRGSDRVFSLEKLRLEALMVSFPDTMMEGCE